MISLSPNSQLHHRYQRLLTEEWTSEFPEQVLALLWDCVADSIGDGPLAALLDLNSERHFPVAEFGRITKAITDATRFTRHTRLPGIPERYTLRSKRKDVLTACRLAAWLTFEAHAEIRGDLGFLADVQSLAFQAAIHFVLPELKRKHPSEHAVLVNAAALYAIGYSTFDFAHYVYMVAILHEYLGNSDLRLQAIEAAFHLTPPQDHSWLTKAQEVWTALLERQEFSEAQRFLLSVHAIALPGQRDEVLEMLADGIRYSDQQEKDDLAVTS